MARTENGALSLASPQPIGLEEKIQGRTSFFFKIVRNLLDNAEGRETLNTYLSMAHSENVRDTLILVFHLRNCRKNGGKGERELFRQCIEWYVSNGHGDLMQKNLHCVVEFGRWDDVLVCPGGHDFMAKQLLKDFATPLLSEEKKSVAISLAAKWAPSACMRNKKSRGKHVPMVAALNAQLEATKSTLFGRFPIREKEYRKLLSTLRERINVVERLMCANRWDDIDFNKVPSNAMHLYSKDNKAKEVRKRRRVANASEGGAFQRHCPERFSEWRRGLASGKTSSGAIAKVNAGQLFPYEVVAEVKSMERYSMVETETDAMKLTEAKWKVLEDNVRAMGTMQKCLFVADVSGSMTACVSDKSSVTCLDVAVSLALLGSRCSVGSFKDLVITFSGTPTFFDLSSAKKLSDAIIKMESMDWGANTNLQAVFEMILQRGQQFHVPVEEFPTTIVILSDMEFDSCITDGDVTNFQAAKKKYADAGYAMPTLVFWNLRSSVTNQFPVSADENGTVLMSGFSPSLMKELINGDASKITPWKIIRNVLDSDVYNCVQV